MENYINGSLSLCARCVLWLDPYGHRADVYEY